MTVVLTKQDNNPRRYSSEEIKFNLKYNPVSFVPKQADFERVGEHVISEKEIKMIWEKLPEESQTGSWAVKLVFTTGQRLGEIIRVRWEHNQSHNQTYILDMFSCKDDLLLLS